MATIPSIGCLPLKNVCYAYSSGLWPGVFSSSRDKPVLPLAWAPATSDPCPSSPSSNEDLELMGEEEAELAGFFLRQAGKDCLNLGFTFSRMKVSYFYVSKYLLLNEI